MKRQGSVSLSSSCRVGHGHGRTRDRRIRAMISLIHRLFRVALMQLASHDTSSATIFHRLGYDFCRQSGTSGRVYPSPPTRLRNRCLIGYRLFCVCVLLALIAGRQFTASLCVLHASADRWIRFQANRFRFLAPARSTMTNLVR